MDIEKTELRIAVVGAGLAGQSHAYGYRNASMTPALADVDVVLDCIVDTNLSLAESAARKYGFLHFSGSLDDVLNDPMIEAVSVALPNNQYAAVIPKLLDAGKHVFAEKPLGLSVAEAETLTRSAEGHTQLISAVGFSFRRIPALAALQRAVAEGHIGAPYFARVSYLADYACDRNVPLTWRFQQEHSGGGALLDIGAHAVDTLQYVAGDIQQITSAQIDTTIEERPIPTTDPGAEPRLGAVTNDDTAFVTVKLDGGALGSIQVSRVASGVPNELSIEIFGSSGHAAFSTARFNQYTIYETWNAISGQDGPRAVISGPASPYFSQVASMPGRGVSTGYGDAFLAEVQAFVSAVHNRTPMEPSFATATKTMRVIGAAYDAARTGRSVTLGPVAGA